MAIIQTNFTNTEALVKLLEAAKAEESNAESLVVQFANQLSLLESEYGWTFQAATDTYILGIHDSGVVVDMYGANFSASDGNATINQLVLTSPAGNFDVGANLTVDLGSGVLSGSIHNISLSLGSISFDLSGSWDINSITGTITNWSLEIPTYEGLTTLSYKGYLQLDTWGNINETSITKFVLTSANGSSLVYSGSLLDLESGGSMHDITVAAMAGNDKITGAANSQSLNGFAGSDTIYAGEGNDTLNGGTGNDRLLGQAGNDTYIVDNPGDVVVEWAGQGVDQVRSSVTYVLGEHVENLILTGSNVINGTGNGQSNSLMGNAANNVLKGGAGSDTLNGNAGADSLLGQDGNDVLYAGEGNDTLNGGPGKDSLNGGLGNDVYIVDNASDEVVESEGAGKDHVMSSFNYNLGNHVEILTLAGSEAINGIGNSQSNVLTGNAADNALWGGSGADKLTGNGGADSLFGEAGNDILVGNGGKDVLTGGKGADVLAGGTGNDTFAFNNVSESPMTDNRDVIEDFSAGDVIDLASIDANLNVANNQKFTHFTTGLNYSGFTSPGSLFYETDSHILWGNNDADGEADFSIQVNLSGLTTLAVTDILL